MPQLTDLYIKADTLKTILKTLEAKNEKGILLTVSIQDEANSYGQNVSAFVSQSKEDREAGKNRFYVGNGKTFWSKNGEFVPKKEGQTPEPNSEYSANEGEEEDGLPF